MGTYITYTVFLHGKGLFSHLLPFVAFITFHSGKFIIGLQCICLVQVDRLICHLCISIEAKLERCIHIAPVVSEKVERDNSHKVNL